MAKEERKLSEEEIKNRLQEIIDELEDEESEADTEKLEEESRSLTNQLKEMKKMEARNKLAEDINNGVVEAEKIEVESEEARKQELAKVEERANALREKRSITVSSSNLLTPNHQAKEINDTFTPVSRLIDNADVENLDGGESYQESYVKTYGTGGQTDEGDNYTSSGTEPTFGYADINKVKVTAYAEISEEAEKLPAQNYVEKVEKNMTIALKKKMVEYMLNGTGNKQFMGIFKNTQEITGVTDVTASAINNQTLDDIIFAYGSDEDTEEDAVLILSKADLKAFSKVRTNDGKKFYDIDTKNKTIDGIPYIISSQCHPVSATGETAGTYNCMAYGSLKNYKIAIFSDMEVSKSTDYKFKEGMTCYKSSVMAGGNVVKYQGFVRVNKVVA